MHGPGFTGFVRVLICTNNAMVYLQLGHESEPIRDKGSLEEPSGPGLDGMQRTAKELQDMGSYGCVGPMVSHLVLIYFLSFHFPYTFLCVFYCFPYLSLHLFYIR